MYCPNCGEFNPDENLYCTHCGVKLIDDQDTAGQTGAAAVNVQDIWQSVAQGGQKGLNWAKQHYRITIPVAVVILAVILFALLSGLAFNPKNTVERYFNALQQGDTSAIYSCMDLPESEFISYDSFCTMWEQMGSPSLQVSSYEIRDADARRSSTTSVDPLALLFGQVNLDAYDSDSDSQEEDSLVKTYTVEYHVSGNSDTQSLQVRLVGEPVAGGLFKNYKVLSDYIMLNYNVTVPAGTTVTVDEIPLSGATSSEGSDEYTIPAIFRGSHTITVDSTLGSMSDTLLISSSGDGYGYTGYTCSEIPYNESTRAAIFEQAKTQLSAVISSALAREAWPADVAVSPDGAEDVSYTYQRLQENLFNTDRGSGYTSFQITDINDTSDQDQSFSPAYTQYTCVVEYMYSYIYRYVNWYDEVEMQNGSSYGSAYLTYEYNDGTWQLCGLSISY